MTNASTVVATSASSVQGRRRSTKQLLCDGCGCARGYVSRELRTFLEKFLDKYGWPDQPIVLRTGKVHKPEPPAVAAETVTADANATAKPKRKRKKLKMRMNTLFPSRYTRSSDLDGKRKNVVVSHVTYEEMKNDGKLEKKAILNFKGDAVRPLVINKSKYLAMSAITGSDDCDEWGGAEISLVPCKVAFKGKLVDSIKIEEPAEFNDEITV